MTDISTNEDKVMWDLAGANIEIGEKEEKGVKITVDGRVYFIDVMVIIFNRDNINKLFDKI